MSAQLPPYHPNTTSHHHVIMLDIDKSTQGMPQPKEGSMDSTAWGEWGSAHGEGSWQYHKAIQEITRIRKSRLTLDAELYRPRPTYFPQSAPNIPQHQGFGGHPHHY
jgi:hypothetical protein